MPRWRVHRPVPWSRLIGKAGLAAAALLLPWLARPADAGTLVRISGTVRCGIFGFGIPDVKMYGLPGDPETDGDGEYSAFVPYGWSGAVYPLSDALHFDPFGRGYVNVTADIVHDYKTTLPVPTISGFVRTPTGVPVETVLMVGLPKTPMTNSHGFYLAYVSSGSTRTVVPQRDGYQFDPRNRIHANVSGDLPQQNYTALPIGGILVNPVTGLTTSEDGTKAQFSIVLNSPPGADVFIAISSSDPSEGVAAPAGLTFTPANWNVPQAVTVTGVNDDLRDGHVAYTIITAPALSADPLFHGKDPADVAVTNLDDEMPGVVLNPPSGLVTTEAGGTAQFTVALLGRPTADVTLPIASGDPTEGAAAPPSLTFTPDNWRVPQTVTVTGLDDLDVDGDVAYVVGVGPAASADPGYNGLATPGAALRNRDNDTPPLLGITPAEKLDLGSVEVNQAVEQDTYVVGNAGGSRLTGTVTSSGADFTIVAGGAFDLLGGASQTVRVRFAPTAAGKRSTKLAFTGNGGLGKRSIRGTGTAYTLVVDNLDDEPGKRFEVVGGAWQTAAVQLRPWATDYRIAPTGDGSSAAAWRFQLPYDAVYEVSAWWPSALRTWGSAVPYRTTHSLGNSLALAKQSSKGGKWAVLGRYQFKQGSEWRVEIANNSPGADVVADAIQVKWFAPLPLLKAKAAPEPLSILLAPARGPAPLDVLAEAVGIPKGAACVWQFGDGSRAAGPAALHTYYSPGTYDVTLRAGGRTARATVVVSEASGR